MRVSDHAVIRYLERALGMNIEAIREEICGVIASGEIGSEMIVVEDGCAVTVLSPDMRAMDARRAKRRRNTALKSVDRPPRDASRERLTDDPQNGDGRTALMVVTSPQD